MQRWEYLVLDEIRHFSSVICNGKPSPSDPELDLEWLGQAGWELVTVMPAANRVDPHRAALAPDLRFIFKRASE